MAFDPWIPEPTDGPLTAEELALATRNRGMPLEALRYDLTPTGLHYLLVHFDIPDVYPQTYRLQVGGNVHRGGGLTLDDIRALPSRTLRVTMECAGNGRARLHPRPVSQPWLDEAIGTADWTGTPLRHLLEQAGVGDGTVEIVFTGADHGTEKGYEHDYARSLPLDEALREDVLLAYEMNGRPLEPQHGAPLRLLVPGWYGMASVKWLVRIEASTEPFAGYQQAVAYRYGEGEPVTRIRPRALMAPPGFPDFLTRRRVCDAGPVVLHGRAWSGLAPVSGVQVCIDGRWSDAELGADAGRWAWRPWSLEWDATAGDHELRCRAVDFDGNTQPDDPPWNRGGFGVNHPQTVSVTVRDPAASRTPPSPARPGR